MENVRIMLNTKENKQLYMRSYEKRTLLPRMNVKIPVIVYVDISSLCLKLTRYCLKNNYLCDYGF